MVARPEHWIFAGTGLKKGERIPGLVGWEYHGDPPADLPGLEVVAAGTAWVGGRQPQHWTATVYRGPRGSVVFNASTIFWSQGLSSPPGHMLPWSHWSRPHGPDAHVQRITANVLRRALASGPAPGPKEKKGRVRAVGACRLPGGRAGALLYRHLFGDAWNLHMLLFDVGAACRLGKKAGLFARLDALSRAVDQALAGLAGNGPPPDSGVPE